MLIVTGLLASGRQSKIVAGPHGHELVLTVAQLRALDTWDPSFRPWRDRDYQPGIIRSYKFSAVAAPFAVIGDFNGDGEEDVAIDGRTSTTTVSIVVLSESSSYRIVIVSQSGGVADPAKEWYGVGDDRVEYGLWVFLSRRVPAGAQLAAVVDGTPVRLRYDAFERAYWEKAATAYYWDGRKFVEVITGD